MLEGHGTERNHAVISTPGSRTFPDYLKGSVHPFESGFTIPIADRSRKRRDCPILRAQFGEQLESSPFRPPLPGRSIRRRKSFPGSLNHCRGWIPSWPENANLAPMLHCLVAVLPEPNPAESLRIIADSGFAFHASNFAQVAKYHKDLQGRKAKVTLSEAAIRRENGECPRKSLSEYSPYRGHKWTYLGVLVRNARK